MRRKHTASFILELPIKTGRADERACAIILNAGRNIDNAVLGEGLRRLDLMRESRAHRGASRKGFAFPHVTLGVRAGRSKKYHATHREAGDDVGLAVLPVSRAPESGEAPRGHYGQAVEPGSPSLERGEASRRSSREHASRGAFFHRHHKVPLAIRPGGRCEADGLTWVIPFQAAFSLEARLAKHHGLSATKPRHTHIAADHIVHARGHAEEAVKVMSRSPPPCRATSRSRRSDVEKK
jgi:hypothetical protein